MRGIYRHHTLVMWHYCLKVRGRLVYNTTIFYDILQRPSNNDPPLQWLTAVPSRRRSRLEGVVVGHRRSPRAADRCRRTSHRHGRHQRRQGMSQAVNRLNSLRRHVPTRSFFPFYAGGCFRPLNQKVHVGIRPSKVRPSDELRAVADNYTLIGQKEKNLCAEVQTENFFSTIISLGNFNIMHSTNTCKTK